MDFDRLGPSDPSGSSRRSTTPLTKSTTNSSSCSSGISKKKLIILTVIAAILIITSAAISATLVTFNRSRAGNQTSPELLRGKPTEAISRTCSKTRFPTLCINSLLEFPGSTTATEHDLIHISFNMTLRHVSSAFFASSTITNLYPETATIINSRQRIAYEDCLELLEESTDALARALTSVVPLSTASTDDEPVVERGSTDDVMTWLSTALTNHDTCAEGFENTNGTITDEMFNNLKDLSELVSNSLAIYSASQRDDGDFSGVPIQNKRRLMMNIGDEDTVNNNEDISRDFNFPRWLSEGDRKLMSLSVSETQADIIVSKNGNGTVKTITEAIKMAPEHSKRRFIIYVRAGRYEENNLKIGKKKTNIMLIGDGKGKTIITGRKNVGDGMTTFHTASFAASGAGFVARDITFENYAGPEKHQAVALRVGADHAVVYRCSIIGYQDTCYVHSNRQFFRECDIYGTVDFIFGNAAVVFQKCNFYARKPMAQQKNTITAQNRKDPNQNTGISIHDCRILPAPDLATEKGSIPTYLGRPWKLYSRTVYLLSYIGDHVHPNGWLEWNGEFALDTLYYGEYMNYGPGAAIGQRVKWPGYRVITSTVEANRFTVAQFISGSTWLPSTGVAYLAGLST